MSRKMIMPAKKKLLASLMPRKFATGRRRSGLAAAAIRKRKTIHQESEFFADSFLPNCRNTVRNRATAIKMRGIDIGSFP